MKKSSQNFTPFIYSFFGGGRDLNLGPCIFYALSQPTELSSQGQVNLI